MRNRSLKRQKAINYLLKNPDATAKAVAKHSDLSLPTVYKIIKQRQTPVEVLTNPSSWVRISQQDIFDAAAAVKQVEEAITDRPGVALLKGAVNTFEARGETYGDAKKHWEEVAIVWSAISGTVITADVAVRMMIALKLMRMKQTPGHQDSITDIAGYAAVLAEVAGGNS